MTSPTHVPAPNHVPSSAPDHPAAHPRFSPRSLDFLRQLAENNDRAWFTERKSVYLAELREPMLALIDQLDEAFESYAPAYIRPPEKAMMRIYRDVRFGKDKTPYKTQIAASWPRQGQEKSGGALLYFHISPREVVVAGGAYAPGAPQLLLIREHLLEHHERFREIVAALTADLEPLEGMPLTRPPRGFDADHPAIDLLRQRQWGASATLPVTAALEPDFAAQLSRRFEALMPMVEFLNDAMSGGSERRYRLE